MGSHRRISRFHLATHSHSAFPRYTLVHLTVAFVHPKLTRTQADLDKISAEIERTVGFERLDTLALDKLREWVYQTVTASLQKTRAAQNWDRDAVQLLHRQAEMLEESHRYEDMQAILLEGLSLGGVAPMVGLMGGNPYLAVKAITSTQELMAAPAISCAFAQVKRGVVSSSDELILSFKKMLPNCSRCPRSTFLRELAADCTSELGTEHPVTLDTRFFALKNAADVFVGICSKKGCTYLPRSTAEYEHYVKLMPELSQYYQSQSRTGGNGKSSPIAVQHVLPEIEHICEVTSTLTLPRI